VLEDILFILTTKMILWKSKSYTGNYLFREHGGKIQLKLNCNIDCEFDFILNLEESFNSSFFEVTISINDIVNSLNDVVIEVDEADEVDETILQYNPISGKTTNSSKFNHFKESDGQKEGYFAPLYGVRESNYSMHVEFFLEKSHGLLILPCQFLSLVVNHEVESWNDWSKFLEQNEISKKTWNDNIELKPSYIFIHLYLDKLTNSLIPINAEYINDISISETHISLKYSPNLWERYDKKDFIARCIATGRAKLDDFDASIYEIVSSNCIDDPDYTVLKGERIILERPQLHCQLIEELDFGLAIVQKSAYDLVLIDYYNCTIIEKNLPKRYFYSFQPKWHKSQIYIIAIRAVEQKHSSNFSKPKLYFHPDVDIDFYWNIYSLRDKRWIFKREDSPKGIAIWDSNGSLIINGTMDSNFNMVINDNCAHQLEMCGFKYRGISDKDITFLIRNSSFALGLSEVTSVINLESIIKGNENWNSCSLNSEAVQNLLCSLAPVPLVFCRQLTTLALEKYWRDVQTAEILNDYNIEQQLIRQGWNEMWGHL
jgi:hypothetical protein